MCGIWVWLRLQPSNSIQNLDWGKSNSFKKKRKKENVSVKSCRNIWNGHFTVIISVVGLLTKSEYMVNYVTVANCSDSLSETPSCCFVSQLDEMSCFLSILWYVTHALCRCTCHISRNRNKAMHTYIVCMTFNYVLTCLGHSDLFFFSLSLILKKRVRMKKKKRGGRKKKWVERKLCKKTQCF